MQDMCQARDIMIMIVAWLHLWIKSGYSCCVTAKSRIAVMWGVCDCWQWGEGLTERSADSAVGRRAGRVLCCSSAQWREKGWLRHMARAARVDQRVPHLLPHQKYEFFRRKKINAAKSGDTRQYSKTHLFLSQHLPLTPPPLQWYFKAPPPPKKKEYSIIFYPPTQPIEGGLIWFCFHCIRHLDVQV